MTSRSCVLVALGALLIGGATSIPIASCADDCAPDIIDTMAGGGAGDGGPATQASLDWPWDVALSPDGSLYIADTLHHRLRKVVPSGIISTVAGDGVMGYAGDGGPATQARLNRPSGVAVGADGSLYIADSWNHRIRKVDPGGIITTVAGNGEQGYSGDGGPAAQASLDGPRGVAVGADGSLYIADSRNNRIRKVDPAGIIATVAGNGQPGYSGDGGPATEASLRSPKDVAVGADGALYIADWSNHRIRKVDRLGLISTVAGNGTPDYSGDGGPATQASLNGPYGVAVGADASLYVADTFNDRIREVDSTGIISTVAGGGSPPDRLGDGGLATEASLSDPGAVAVAADGGLYIGDGRNQRIRNIDPLGIITTVAGNGASSYCGDGLPGTAAGLFWPADAVVGADGSLYIADTNNFRVRKIDPAGIITTVAGNGVYGYSGDGGPATEASLRSPRGVAADTGGSVYIADSVNSRIRKVDLAGIITTVAGGGRPADGLGDGGPATEAKLGFAGGVALGPDGSLYIADGGNNRIRKVDLAGVITTVAGNGQYGFSGDGGPATEASLRLPTAVAVGADGSLYIADFRNHRIRKVDPAGVIATVAGNGEPGYAGDGGPATEASLDRPRDVALGPQGSLYIADSWNNRIRLVDPAGVITTVAGDGWSAPDDPPWGRFTGDGGPATEASLNSPSGVAVGVGGSLYIADTYNHRIRKVWSGPCCSPEYEPASVMAGEVVTFHANASPPAAICHWDFGDGMHGGGCDPTHVYSSPGTYLACVTVTNDRGASHTCCTLVEVTCECSVAVIGPWCHVSSGQVGQIKRGRIGAWNASTRACDVVLRVSNSAGTVVFESTRRLRPFRRIRLRFSHTVTPEDVGRGPWTWEVWPVECDERTPGNNVFRRRVTVTNPPRQPASPK